MVGNTKSSSTFLRFPLLHHLLLLLLLITLVVVTPLTVVFAMDPPPPPPPPPLDQAVARHQLGSMAALAGLLSPPEVEVLIRFHQLFYKPESFKVGSLHVIFG
jgi:hypothetical protein